MEEIRFHGRGGQGTVIASKILAVAIAKEGKFVQAFPEFGVERRGAPVAAFLRMDEKPIYVRSRIYEPNHVVILDPTLISTVHVTEGLKEAGWVIVNTEKKPEEIGMAGNYHLITVDATAIAIKHRLGSRTAPIVNTAIVGAVAKVLKCCSFDSLAEAIREDAPVSQEENVQAALEAYEHCQSN